tara:strand:- start:5553 stop:7376 length:1824 start_codon:yes stop_codon:yes gene_type:complete
MALSPYIVTVITKEDAPYNVIPNAPIEIRERLSNGSSGGLSLIYEDELATIPITQTGATADTNGQFVFYAEAAQYNAIYQSQTVPVDMGLTPSTLTSALINDLSQAYTFKTVTLMQASLIVFPVGKKIFWQGYYTESDGGSNWGLVTSGAHTDDGGSIFTLADGNYAEANLKGDKISTLKFGMSPTRTAAQNSVSIQSAIDYVTLTFTAGFGGGAWVYTPSGAYDVEGWIDKKGANILGDGRDRTLFELVGNNKTGMSNASAITQLAANQLTFGEHKGFSFLPKDPPNLAPTGQIIWNFTGYSRWVTTDVQIGWCGGVTGISVQGATAAGAGGPAQWYNNFYNLFLLRPGSWPAGGIGMILGDAIGATEQATTWAFYGGRTSGAGTGISLNRCNTISFYNHIIEGTDVLVGSAAGTNFAINTNFYPLYLEGSVSNQMVIYPNAQNTGIFGLFGTGMQFTDNGEATQMFGGGSAKMFAGSAGARFFDIECESSATRAPKLIDLSGPMIVDLEDSSGNLTKISNSASVSSATSAISIENGAGDVLFRSGTSSAAISASTFVGALGGANISTFYTASALPNVSGTDGDINYTTAAGGGAFQRRSGAWVAL